MWDGPVAPPFAQVFASSTLERLLIVPSVDALLPSLLLLTVLRYTPQTAWLSVATGIVIVRRFIALRAFIMAFVACCSVSTFASRLAHDRKYSARLFAP